MLKFVLFSETENEVQSCYKQWICNSIISKPLMDMQGQAEAEENLCHTLYNCHHRKSVNGATVDDVLDHIVDLERKRKRRSTGGLFFGRPFRKPKGRRRPECQKCEKKRSSCTNVSNFCAKNFTLSRRKLKQLCGGPRLLMLMFNFKA